MEVEGRVWKRASGASNDRHLTPLQHVRYVQHADVLTLTQQQCPYLPKHTLAYRTIGLVSLIRTCPHPHPTIWLPSPNNVVATIQQYPHPPNQSLPLPNYVLTLIIWLHSLSYTTSTHMAYPSMWLHSFNYTTPTHM
eukprot:1372190-Amorphochlora_amoeboformis.AAC.1